ncbi:AAA family ATPase [Streptomyces yaizuensis]|uniref:LuxR C-terminal-related transcriptional regulator n=1 Tax=Streptomyces yaizuensis TaxID=2989713 RepID=A0ABQ5NZV4_9ACTN|nr:AAA family ATPase [Streptomyces sp. YSPA8]GLF95496.1 LuxR C-terminal-related transcriptional regulator [Streptomyces sp. YSPA8]
MHHILVERWSEILLLNRAVDALCQGTGDLFMIEGGYGIGRTALLLELEKIASARQLTVCTARCSTMEADFRYGVMRQLLEPHLSTLAADGTEAARSVAELLRTADSATGGHDDVHVLQTMLQAVRGLAERAPVVLAVDDLNFCDAPSLQVLAYAARRLKGWPVAIVGTRRRGEPVTAPAMLAALQEAGGWTALHPASLTAAGTRELVDSRLGRTPVSVVEEVHALTGGNPMLLDTVIRALSGPHRKSTGADWSPGALESLVGATVRTRLSHLPAQVPRIAETIALLEGRADCALTAEAAGLPEREGAGGLAVLAGMGLLTDAPYPSYVHRVVGKALRRLPESVVPERVHRRAAEGLHRRGAPRADVARHLLRTGPTGTEWAPELLRTTAVQAVHERRATWARTLLRRALEESLPDEVRACIQTSLDGVELITDPHGLVPRLRVRLGRELTPHARVRTVLAYAQGLLLTHQVEQAAEALEECRTVLAALPLSRAREALLCQIDGAEAMTALFGPSAAARITGLLAKLPETSGSPLHRLSLEGLRAAIEVRAPADEVMHTLDEALTSQLSMGRETLSMPYTPFTLLWTDQLELVDQWCDAMLTGRGAVTLSTTVVALALRSASRLESGRLDEAERDARQALDLLGEQRGPDPMQSLVLAPLLKILVELDRTEEAVALVEDRGCAGELPDLWPHTMVLEARGRLRGARGDIEGALEDLTESGRRMERWGTANPAVSRWRSEAAFMRDRLGDTRGALRLVEEELHMARRWGTTRAIGVALRAKGLILGGEEGAAALAEAVDVLGSGPARLEEAYAETGLGIVRRRGNNRRAARESLRRALARAQQLGAVRLASRVHAELLAAGGLPRRDEHFGAKALTASEYRVAQLAAGGRTNGSIARELFVTRRTVETHLTRAYRKLGIQGRSELGRVLQA